MSEKIRLDVYLADNGLVESREKARAVIMAGDVYVDNQKADKPGFFLKGNENIEVRSSMKYVSRGGYKLEKAMQVYDICLENKICADIGASTGGFTDCMLQNGASKVYAVDVGYGQLAWQLRCSQKVVNLERTNFRYCTKEQIPDALDFASVDVSFISLKIILPVLKNLLKENGECVCLIKPQFEAGKEKVGKKGVVKDKQVHIEVIDKIITFALQNKFIVKGLEYSPIKGPQGNIEYLIYLQNSTIGESLIDVTSKEIVEKSHNDLDK
ncbi:MAG: TlyA family RNA methyltransferase [Acutalibacteraceae bacterium]|nr:TlyA family RNA methyltransferase [Acutalibacteraceae bacterium]